MLVNTFYMTCYFLYKVAHLVRFELTLNVGRSHVDFPIADRCIISYKQTLQIFPMKNVLPVSDNTRNNEYVRNNITKHNKCTNKCNTICFAIIFTSFFSKGFCPYSP